MYKKNLKPYASMLFWFALGLTASLLFCKSLILNWDTIDRGSQATERPRIHTPNLALSKHIRKQSLRDS
jgi:hypothetical protein